MMYGSYESHSPYTVSRTLAGLAIGGAVIGAGVILAPHILPALGIGSAEMAEESMFVLHTSAEAGGSGMAGWINRHMIASVPLIGAKLAEGGLFNAGVTAAVGIGGVLLGNFIEEKEDGRKAVKWGSVIKYGALVTSALIALPTVLTALSAGLIFLSTLARDVHLANAVVNVVEHTLGTAGNMENSFMGLSGAAAALPHFLTCGVSLAPVALLAFLSGRKHKHAAHAPQKYSDGSIAAEITVDKPTAPNRPCHATLTLTDNRSGEKLSADELAVVHTEKLHLFVVDQSLKDYHHIHPVPTGKPGEMEFSFTPKSAARYNAWADFTLMKEGKNHRIKMDIDAAKPRDISPNIRVNSSTQAGDLTFEWSSPAPLVKGQPAIVDVMITDAAGKPVADLEPVMGAFAHMVGFSADGNSLVHTHPLGAEPSSPNARGGPKLRFHVEPDCDRAVQFYVQVRRGGRDVFAPFGQAIAPALTHAGKQAAGLDSALPAR